MQKIKNFLNSNFDLIVCSLIILLGVFWFYVSYHNYHNFGFSTADTSIAEQAIWNVVNGNGFYQSTLGQSNLREHLNFIQFLYLPFYKIFPHTLTLFFVIQSLYITGVIYLYKVAKRNIGKLGAIFSVLIFIINPITSLQVVGPMHVVAVAGPIFLFLLLAYFEKKYKLFLTFLILTLLVSEFVFPTVFMLGVIAIIDRRSWKWFVPPFVGSLILFLVAKFYITVGLSKSQSLMDSFKKSIGGVSKFSKRIDFVEGFLRPVFYVIPFFSKYALLLLPSLVLAILIVIPGRLKTGSHVFSLVPAILVLIFMDVFVRADGLKKKVLIGLVSVGLILSLGNVMKNTDISTSKKKDSYKEAINFVVDGGSVTSDTKVGPHLCRRKEFVVSAFGNFNDYIIKKRKKTKNIALEDAKDFDKRIIESGLYKEVFYENEVAVFIKKDKLKELLNLSIEEIEGMSQDELRRKLLELRVD